MWAIACFVDKQIIFCSFRASACMSYYSLYTWHLAWALSHQASDHVTCPAGETDWGFFNPSCVIQCWWNFYFYMCLSKAPKARQSKVIRIIRLPNEKCSVFILWWIKPVYCYYIFVHLYLANLMFDSIA